MLSSKHGMQAWHCAEGVWENAHQVMDFGFTDMLY